MSSTLYDFLGVHRGAEPAEIRSAWRALIADLDPSDPRTYVVLGKLLVQQKRFDEARKLYADGTSNSGEAPLGGGERWGRGRGTAPPEG